MPSVTRARSRALGALGVRASVASSRASKAAASTAVTSAIAAGVAFIVNVLMARLLGPGARGSVAWVLQGAYFIAPLLALGVDRSTLKSSLLRGRAPRWHVWSLGFAGFVTAMVFDNLLVAAAFLIASGGAFLSIERAHGILKNRLGRYVAIQAASQAWILAASAALFINHVEIVKYWVLVYTIPAVAMLAVPIAASLRYGFRLPQAPTRRTGSGTVTSQYYLAASKFMPGAFFAISTARVERLLLPVLASSAELGLYISVATASEILLWVSQGFSESKVGDHSRAQASRRDVAQIALKSISWYAMVGSVLSVLIWFLLIPALGPGFEGTRILVIPLCASSAVWAAYRHVLAAWIGGVGASRSSGLEAGGAVLTTVLAVIGIMLAGALGAALACVVSYSVMIVVAILLWPVECAPGSVDAEMNSTGLPSRRKVV